MFAQTFIISLVLGLAAATPISEFSSPVVNLEANKLIARSACAAAGVVNGQCGRYYSSTGCNDQIGSIDPGSCTGTCYNSNTNIKSLKAVGDGTYGTNCVLYSGFDCQGANQIGETGNSITGGGKCYSNGNGGNSFRCWRKC
ncbi:hypothetical protein QBC43DRAFT_360894 [Cladorrhinum sp. PSN259]|nr:hypothetical protein QBC43DRAFT_360894 [Cladorrhinum sp. PSN259]